MVVKYKCLLCHKEIIDFQGYNPKAIISTRDNQNISPLSKNSNQKKNEDKKRKKIP